MKRFFVLLGMLLVTPILLQAYQTGAKAKSSFGNPQTAQTDNSSGNTAPATRSFTNYSNRPNWNKGVQSNPVQTNVAGQQVTEFQAVEPTVQSGKLAAVAAPQEKNAPAAASAAGSGAAKAGGTAQTSGAAQAGEAAKAGSAADMAQATAALQGMQNLVQGMGSMMGGAGGAQAGKGGSSGGTPDISALLNSMGGGAAGAAGGKTK